MPLDEPNALTLIVQSVTRLETKLDEVNNKLDQKADRAEVDRLERRLDHVENRAGALEGYNRLREERAEVHQQRDQRSWSHWQKLGAAITTLLLVLGNMILAIVAIASMHH